MALTTYGSLRSTVSGASVAAAAGGATTQSKTLYCWISALNRVGASLPTSLGSVTIASGEKLVATITSDAWNTASEDCRAFLLAASESDDVSTAAIIARIETRESKSISYQTGAIAYANEGVPKTFPLSLELTTDEQLKTADVDLVVADESSYPTGADLVDGMIRRVTSLGSQLLQYRASAAEWQDVSGLRVNLSDTRQERSSDLFCGGCDQLVASAAELIYPLPPYPALDSSPQDPGLLLWFNNGLSFDGGDVVSVGTQLFVELSQNGSTALAPKLNEKVSTTLLGYVDRATATLDVSMADVGSPVYFNAADQRLNLSVDLPRGSAAVYLVQFRFKASEVDGIGLAPWKITIRERGLVGTYNPSSSDAFVFDVGDRCLIVPDTPNGIRRLGGRVHTGVYDSQTLSSAQSRFELAAETADQQIVLTADSGGDVTIKTFDDPLRANEGLRALVGTDGDSVSGLVSTASAWATATSIASGELLQVVVDYPCDENGLGTVRSDYPDVAIAGNAQGDFNAISLRVFARISGTIYQRPTDFFVDPDVEQILLISDDIVATWTVVASLPASADADFCLWDLPIVTTTAESGSSSIPDGTSIEVAVAYVFDGDEVTRISHAIEDGCMPIQADATQLSNLATYFETPKETINQVRAIPSRDRNAHKELYCVQLGNITRWNAVETSLTELVFRFETETTASPGTGALRFNAALTEIYVSTTDEESLEVASVLSQIANGTQIQVDFEADATSYRLAAATGAAVDNTTHYTIPVSLVAQSGSLPAATTRVALSIDSGVVRPWDLSRAFSGRWIKDDSDQIISRPANPTATDGEVGDLWVVTDDALSTYGDVLKKTAASTWTTLFNFLPYSLTTADFTQPEIDASVVVDVRNSRLFPVGTNVFIEGGGDYQILSRLSSTSIEVANIVESNTSPSTVINSGARVLISGRQGPTGVKGDQGDIGPAGSVSAATGLTLTERADDPATPPSGDLEFYAKDGGVYLRDDIGTISQVGVLGSQVEALKRVSINQQTGTAYTLALTDEFGLIAMNNAAANTVTIPLNSAIAFPVETQILIGQQGAGTTTISATTGVSLNGIDGGSADLSSQWSVMSLIKIASDSWWLISGSVS